MAKKKRAKQDASAGEIMLVNDSPGEECRVAILRDGRLEDLFTERAATATSVGNIYKAKVSNVEGAIQAAFVDYGQPQRGFLHISDLHPRYFPGGEQSEKVGKKTAHRDRPLIQKALKRGDEILVQVLKEGIGTKGPTLTSYLSIPGRLMVMMPYMDRVGVTRRVEDEDERKAMRKVLDSLDLPDDFGFILRTAGMGQTKRELNRDVAYLTRMWKVMEKRIGKIGSPAELYTESDLVLRTVRDVLRPEIEAIVVDSEDAFNRVTGYLRVIAPRSAPPVVHYKRPMPLFHAFNVERQIETIHAREVDLPSGGRLVIDQTEALVAIDVNSGRSRSARDSETNAYRTNLEAIEEIARQLRLRDLGGLVINDLIDMRQRSRRKEVYEKFGEMLKVDRARTTILPISDFGILEMTRQRMRPSIRMANYVECPGCAGHGEVKAPDMVAADAVREIGYLLHCDETAKLEVVVSPRVASSLLSTKRRVLDAIEDRMAKPVDVRVSESIPVDRVVYYAYDARGSDLDLEKLTPGARPSLEELIAEPDPDNKAEEAKRTGRRRSRRRGQAPPADAAAIALSGEFQRELEALEAEADREEAKDSSEGEAAGGSRKRRRRRRRRRKPTPLIETASRLYVLAKAMGLTSKEIIARWDASGKEKNTGFVLNSHMSTVTPEQASTIQGWFDRPEEGGETESADATTEAADESPAEEQPAPRKRRRRRRRGSASQEETASAEQKPEDSSDASEAQPEPDKKPRKKRAAKKASRKSAETEPADGDGDAPPKKKRARSRKRKKAEGDATQADDMPKKPRRRTLYSSSRRKLAPGAAGEALAQSES
ncbi:MAG: Rne/Rng family ribonuclease [Phycisphaerales bacterium]|nr:Rne/Rng family ribonuclease [Phycisphaerales bacterium]